MAGESQVLVLCRLGGHLLGFEVVAEWLQAGHALAIIVCKDVFV